MPYGIKAEIERKIRKKKFASSMYAKKRQPYPLR